MKILHIASEAKFLIRPESIVHRLNKLLCPRVMVWFSCYLFFKNHQVNLHKLGCHPKSVKPFISERAKLIELLETYRNVMTSNSIRIPYGRILYALV